MSYILKPEIKKLFSQEVSVFYFAHSKNLLQKDSDALQQWLSTGAHAQMHYMENNLEARKNPEHILADVKTALIFLFPYSYGKKIRARLGHLKTDSTNGNNLNIKEDSLIGKELISKYIYGKDYHKTLKKKLTTYAEELKLVLNEDFSYRPVVDSIPFFDRAHAREAGLGFIGKNTLLIRPGTGSFFFIATLLTSLSIEKLAKENSKKNPIASLDCGTCTKCIDACPTQALELNKDKRYFLNANKCLSYLSIEHRETIEAQYIPHFKDTIYGCDICQTVCPYNFVTLDSAIIPEFSHPHTPFTFLTVLQVAEMTKEQYEQWFGGTAAIRAKYDGLVRNALYHLYAIRHPNIEFICQKALHSQSGIIQKTAQQILSFLQPLS